MTKHAIEIESREERLKCKVVQKGELGDRDELGSNLGNSSSFFTLPTRDNFDVKKTLYSLANFDQTMFCSSSSLLGGLRPNATSTEFTGEKEHNCETSNSVKSLLFEKYQATIVFISV